jgi:hypothetical protein
VSEKLDKQKKHNTKNAVNTLNPEFLTLTPPDLSAVALAKAEPKYQGSEPQGHVRG